MNSSLPLAYRLIIFLFLVSCNSGSGNTQTEHGNFNCYPTNYNPVILSSPHPDSLHQDWLSNEVGTSWSFISKTKVTNDDGVFLAGDLVSPRGVSMGAGPFYVIFSEWTCL